MFIALIVIKLPLNYHFHYSIELYNKDHKFVIFL